MLTFYKFDKNKVWVKQKELIFIIRGKRDTYSGKTDHHQKIVLYTIIVRHYILKHAQ